MPTVITQGAASAKGYGFGARATAANYIEDVFSTYLYTGNGTTQAISNGIDLSGKGGLVWNKQRNGTFLHCLTDTARGVGNSLDSADTAANDYSITRVSAFNADGFTMGGNSRTNSNGSTYVSWTFRKQAKFFDVVTYTGNGNNNTAVISHSLGSVPGCIIIKKTSTSSDWYVYHRSFNGGTNAYQYGLFLNTTAAVDGPTSTYHYAAPTSTNFYPNSLCNSSGATYVAYLFAHDAGGFGAAGTDNVISCGSFNTGGSGSVSVTLNYEPQWVMIKRTDSTSDWIMLDTMRGWANEETVSSNDMRLKANTSEAESADSLGFPSATGFQASGFGLNQTWIYIAIRRGPMKTPTSGTSVFSPILSSAGSGTDLTTNFPVDLQITGRTAGTTATTKGLVFDRLRGVSTTTTGSGRRIQTHSTAAEVALTNGTLNWGNTGFQMPGLLGAASSIFWNFRRAPGFFDVVCYTGTATSGSGGGFSHNLGVVPELIIIKNRDGAYNWKVKLASVLGRNDMELNNTGAAPTVSSTYWDNLTDTSTKFYTRADNFEVDAVGSKYVAYLFATCPGVSKVGSYTGSGTTKQIDCGFTGGARFVLIKRTDSTGDWYVWDSARGIVAGNDPYLLLNSTAAEVTGTDYIDTYSAGFEISSTAPAAINANGGSFIFLAIA